MRGFDSRVYTGDGRRKPIVFKLILSAKAE
nr:MAG TPA: hypothetical protein [Caudoviricetes sp.]